jgi:hypothetical protein
VVLAALYIAVACACGIAVLVAINRIRLQRRIGREVRALVAHAHAPAVPAAEASASECLPEPVRRYRELAVGDHAPVHTVRLYHGGTFRVRRGAKSLPIRGVQVFTADPPGFVWLGSVQMAPGVWIEARDMLADGKGSMRVLLDDTLNLAVEEGAAMDRGAALRVLAEMPWFPTALFDARYVSWSAIDANHARATLRLGGEEVSCIFEFGPDGLPAGALAERPRETGEVQPWGGTYGDYRSVDGLKVPFEAEVTWHLPEGPFTYAHWAIDCLEYDAVDDTVADDELRPS